MSRLRERLHSSLWAIPAAFVLLAVLLALALTALDRELEDTAQVTLIFGGSAEAGRSILSVIAGSMVSLTGLVFSILVVVFQLTSSQFSPRALRTFLQDRVSKLTLASFLGTFAFSLVVMRSIRQSNGAIEEFIPRLAITAAVAVSLVSMGVFVYYIHHIALAIRVSSIVEKVHDETARLIERTLPELGERESAADYHVEESEQPAGQPRVVHSQEAGYVVNFNAERLQKALVAEAAVARLVPQVGDFVGKGQPLFEVWGADDEPPEDAFRRCLILANERTLEQDVQFGFRQLVDIAVRALSPGMNDPTTARYALDRIGDLLFRLAGRERPREAYRDDDGRLRLIVNRPSWEQVFSESLEEIAHYGKDSPLVVRDLHRLLGRLQPAVPLEALPGLEQISEKAGLGRTEAGIVGITGP